MSEHVPVVDRDELVANLSALIAQRSDYPHATEEACCRAAAAILAAAGIPSRIVEAAAGRPNLYAVLEGRDPGPTVILNGHIDVVPADPAQWNHPPFVPVVEHGRLYGRGAADMKGGVASMMQAVLALQRAGCPFRGRIVLFLNVDEERTNLGMTQFLGEAMTADFAIIAEPTENAICTGHRGVARYYVRTSGTPEHVASAARPDNAVEKMADAIVALRRYREGLVARPHPFLGSASGGVTLIHGGLAGNIVPPACQITLDRRLLPGETKGGVLEEIRGFLASAGADCEVETESWLDASLTDAEHPMVGRLRHAVAAAGGDDRPRPFPATCEAPFFTLHRGIPTAIFGPGSIAQAHVVDEFVRIAELEAHCRILLAFLTEA